MSFDVFLQGFAAGQAADSDGDAVLAVLEPLITTRFSGGARIVTSDGDAVVYMGSPSQGLMFNRPHGERVWDVMYELARTAGLVVMPVGCGACLANEALLDELPEDIPKPVVIVHSGADLIEAVRSAPNP